jgi:hypothetical protein
MERVAPVVTPHLVYKARKRKLRKRCLQSTHSCISHTLEMAGFVQINAWTLSMSQGRPWLGLPSAKGPA